LFERSNRLSCSRFPNKNKAWPSKLLHRVPTQWVGWGIENSFKIWQVKLLVERSKWLSCSSFPSENGRWPWKLLYERSKNTNCVWSKYSSCLNFPNEKGILSPNWLPAISQLIELSDHTNIWWSCPYNIWDV